MQARIRSTQTLTGVCLLDKTITPSSKRGNPACVYKSLPPASEGWGKYNFYRRVSVHGGGGGVTHGLWAQVPFQGNNPVLSLVLPRGRDTPN